MLSVCRIHMIHVMSDSIAQACVYELGQNRFKHGELNVKKFGVILPPLIRPHHESTFARSRPDVKAL